MLMKGKSQKAFKHNIKTEYEEGKPLKQSLAIAYAMKRKSGKKMAKGGEVGSRANNHAYNYDSEQEMEGVNRSLPRYDKKRNRVTTGESHMGHSVRRGDIEGAKKVAYSTIKEGRNVAGGKSKRPIEGLSHGGAIHADHCPCGNCPTGYADGGETKDESLSKTASDFFSRMSAPTPTPQTQEDKYKAIRESNAANAGHFAGGPVYDVKTPQEMLNMDEDNSLVPDHPDYYLRPTQHNPANIAARHEDDKDLNQHAVHPMDSGEYGIVDRIMDQKSKNFASLDRYSEGGYVDDEQDIVDRIMHKRDEPFSDLDRYSRGGQIANQEHGENNNELAGFSPNEFDDLVLRDDLESSYGEDDNSGDALGNEQEDEDRRDIVSRVMSSRRKKDKLPRPA